MTANLVPGLAGLAQAAAALPAAVSQHEVLARDLIAGLAGRAG